MRTKRVNIFVSIILIVAAFALTLPLFFRAEEVKAATPVTGEKVLPVSEMELTALDRPTSVAYKNDNYAVISDGLFAYVNERPYQIPLSDFATGGITQVRFFTDDTLFVNNYSIIKKITFTQSGYSIEELKYNNDTVSCTCFDVNDNYFITSSGDPQGSYKVYQIENGIINYRFTKESDKNEIINGDKPIALNGENIFFVANESVQTRKTTDSTSDSDKVLTVVPDNMIADDNFLYYIKDNKIYRVSVNGGEPQNLIPDNGKWFNEGESYDLGKLASPTGLCFRNGNLLISDSSLNAVQEFKIVNDKLEFTGFAIAQSEKTAYNRIGKVKKLDRYGNRVAALSDKKLTVMTIDDTFDGYNKANFKNYFVNEMTPTNFALGKTLLIAVTDTKQISCINLDDGTKNTPVTFTDGEGVIKDVTYQSGTFYVLTNNGGNSFVFSISEKDFSCDKADKTTIDETTATSVAIDVFGKETTSAEFSDLATDLAGNVYGLKSDGKIYKNGVDTGLDGVKAFAMDFDEKKVYYADGNAEYLYVTENLGNLAISSLTLPDGYALKGESAKRIASYKIKDEKYNAYVFEATDNNGVKFKDLADGTQTNEYILLGKRDMGDTSMAFLAGENGAIIADERHLAELQPDELTVDKDVYVTTGVRAYYLPIITQNNLYTVIRNGNDVSFSKNDCVRAKSKTTFFGRDFYFVGATVNGETFDCYVPVDFTVDELSKDYKYETFTIEKVNKTDVFSDEAMTVKTAELNKGAQVRVISNNGDALKIAYLSGEEWTEGFIKSSAIIDEGKTAVRNVLIVLAVITCACGSLTFFILRKRK